MDEAAVETAVLLTSEVVTNAVVHCATDVQLRLTVDDSSGALVEVIDSCTLAPMQRDPDPESVAGRGLAMIELLSSAYGTVPIDHGKVVWFAVGEISDLCLPGAPGWTPGGVEGGADPSVTIRLLQLPVELYEAMRDHNESLLREYQIHLLSAENGSAPGDDHSVARDDLARVARARAAVAAAVHGPMLTTGLAAAGAAARVDVTMQLSAEDAAACDALPRVLDRAEALAREGRFLTRPALPEMVSLRNWLFPEVAAQAEGAEPSVWVDGDALVAPPLAPAVDTDLGWVAETDRAVVVADHDNRILAASPAAADLLGWPRDELAGQRLTRIVPPSLREAHVAGYSRHVRTGRARVLGRTLEVPALRRDGNVVPVRLRIEQDTTGPGRLYLGWLERAEPGE